MAVLMAVMTSACLLACSEDDDNNPLIGTWDGDHSSSYFVDWTFNSNGTGEEHVQDGDLGSWYSFKYVVTDYDSSIREGHVTITFTSGRWSGESDNYRFVISESGRALTLGGGYYTKNR